MLNGEKKELWGGNGIDKEGENKKVTERERERAQMEDGNY